MPLEYVHTKKLLIPISSISLRLNLVIDQITKPGDILKSLNLHIFALHGYKVRFVSSLYPLCMCCDNGKIQKTLRSHYLENSCASGISLSIDVIVLITAYLVAKKS